MPHVSISGEPYPLKTKRFFALARIVSQKSNHPIPLGAVVVQKGKVVSVGYNRQYKTHPISNTWTRTLHAEMDSVIGVDRGVIRSGDVYVYREDSHGVPKMAKPCLHCQHVLRAAGIRKVFYTIINNQIGVMKL